MARIRDLKKISFYWLTLWVLDSRLMFYEHRGEPGATAGLAMFVPEISIPVCPRAQASWVPFLMWQTSGGQVDHFCPRPPLPTSVISCTLMEKKQQQNSFTDIYDTFSEFS